MKHYLNPNTNEIYAYELDGSQDHLIPSHFVSITDFEADNIRKEKLKEYLDSLSYKEKRVMEYPSFADQFDLLYHGGYDVWKKSIQAVKDKYPKP